MARGDKFQKDVPCMFCGQMARLQEEPSWMKGVHRAYIRCVWCDISFIANFHEAMWTRMKEVK